ncbi:hypothetical protein ATO10_09638 [Actibacterium atlanticum]|uniref:DNA gyrase inhibitor YacG n=1 Tax=Actibacterium atlanticum TaxID=1461693 RepID=A0A058ZKE6_9RHOB|nr:DNA gyrase inhibitor YacG [Actibacterium atlanticum]KCV82099.1 hypothetical protein ATO10_09638 [Actibacterium atlanticum]
MSCPICQKDPVAKYRPFCSSRCADLDLAKWLNGSYSTPADDSQSLEEAIQALEHESRKPH